MPRKVKTKTENRSLYDCFQAKVKGRHIRCAAGHALRKTADGTIPITLLIRGNPLEMAVCQGCRDFDQMDGGKLEPQDRGWLHILKEQEKSTQRGY